MKRTLATLATAASLTLPVPALANEDAAYAEAEAAIRAFRAQSFLVTPCESAFSDFWKAFRADGNQGLVYRQNRFGARTYFGYGTTSSEPLLAAAQDACREQAGRHGGAVLEVLRDRALLKERKLHQFEHAERVIGN